MPAVSLVSACVAVSLVSAGSGFLPTDADPHPVSNLVLGLESAAIAQAFSGFILPGAAAPPARALCAHSTLEAAVFQAAWFAPDTFGLKPTECQPSVLAIDRAFALAEEHLAEVPGATGSQLVDVLLAALGDPSEFVLCAADFTPCLQPARPDDFVGALGVDALKEALNARGVDFTGLVLKADLAARLSAAVRSAAPAAPAPLIFDFTVGDLLACGHENLAPGGARRGGVLGWLPAWFDGGRGLGFERAAWTRFCKPLLAFAFAGRYVDEDESDPSEVGQGLGLAINKFAPQPASLFFGAPLDKSATREESLAILRLRGAQVALEQLVPLLPFLDFEPRELVPAVLGPPAVVGGSPEVVVEATFCMVPPAVSALPVDPMPPVFDTATVRKLRSFSADMLSNSLVANILACAHAASASLPVRLGGSTLATLPHSMHLCETYLRGFLRLLGFNAFGASHGLAPILDVAQRLILEDADPSPFGLGSAAASSVDDLFGTFFATLSLRANTFVQNASRPGLIPLVVPGDVTTRRLEHVTKALDERRADRALCRLRSSGPTSKPSVASTYPLALAAAAKAAAASSGASSRVAAPGAPLASSTRAAAAAAPSARAPLHLKAGEYVPAKNVVDGPDSRMFVDAPSTNLVKLGSLAFRRTELVAFISTLGHAPGSYVLSSLLISKRNPEFKDLLRFANVSGGKAPILMPSDNWIKDALSAPFLDTAHSRIQTYQQSFFR